MRSTPAVHLSMLRVDLVDSADEISYHLIECAHVALQSEREARLETGGSGISRKTCEQKASAPPLSLETPEATKRAEELSPVGAH